MYSVLCCQMCCWCYSWTPPRLLPPFQRTHVTAFTASGLSGSLKPWSQRRTCPPVVSFRPPINYCGRKREEDSAQTVVWQQQHYTCLHNSSRELTCIDHSRTRTFGRLETFEITFSALNRPNKRPRWDDNKLLTEGVALPEECWQLGTRMILHTLGRRYDRHWHAER